MSEAMAFTVVMLGLVGVGVAAWIWTDRRRRPLAADASIDWPPGWQDNRLSRLARPGAVLIALLATAGLFGGGWYAMLPSRQEVYNRYVDQIDAMASRFDRIAKRLPAPGQPLKDGSRLVLDPLPLYDRTRDLVNTEFVSEQSLVNPAQRNHGDLFLSGDLSLYLHWRHSPPYTTDSKAPRDMPHRIESALAYRYLVVIRTLDAADYEAFFFDLASTELLFGLRFSGGTRAQAVSQLLRELRMRTNGTFVGG